MFLSPFNIFTLTFPFKWIIFPVYSFWKNLFGAIYGWKNFSNPTKNKKKLKFSPVVCNMTKIFQFQKGNMVWVWYFVWTEYFPRLKLGEYEIGTTYIGPYYMSGADIMYDISLITPLLAYRMRQNYEILARTYFILKCLNTVRRFEHCDIYFNFKMINFIHNTCTCEHL